MDAIVPILVILILVVGLDWILGAFSRTKRDDGSIEDTVKSPRETQTRVPANELLRNPQTVSADYENFNEKELEESAVVLLNGVTFSVSTEDFRSHSCLARTMEKPLPFYMTLINGTSLTDLKRQLEEWRKKRLRFASLPLPESDQRAIHLVIDGEILERVRPRLNERVLSHFLSLGRSCLIERLEVVAEPENLLRAFVDLNTKRSVREVYHESVERSRVWDIDLASSLDDSDVSTLWAGVNGQGTYIVRNPRFLDKKSDECSYRLIVELTENTATVREISLKEWASTAYKSFKQLSHGDAIRGYCLQLYEKHRQEIWEQVKAWFIHRNADLCQEIGFPIFIDKEFKTLYDETVSSHMRQVFARDNSSLLNIEREMTRSYGILVDSCRSAGRRPTSFSTFCLQQVGLVLMRTREDEEIEEWESETLAERLKEFGQFDEAELLRCPYDDQPLNRF
ncbi:hypothetical protein SAMN05216203_1505 [Marinobacter daqiaonensis]|uniref:Uncharacterized protein n=1 Tax=Marinobacter daqiaonensis TaxID=650891 RepID=A0A1I6HSN6_9GAMM|nr:hypothetical protein [Marinobacter daqiaonensis]SFR57481.1 hypothetical protein SAMN05216203_1505 [Marinobacter daqiaonensis]